jgi:SAM-dependent methyltransferase
MMHRDTDGFGCGIEEHLHGRSVGWVIERDDGWIEVFADVEPYFAKFKDWPDRQREAASYASGRILDVGCGAGRVALHFQERGHDVVGIDVSPRAVNVCYHRGVKNVRLLPITQITGKLGKFDTIVLFGGNFGLVENPLRARWLLRRFHSVTSPSALILAESRNPYVDAASVHRRYHRRNRLRGRMAGQIRVRVRCGMASTPWFDWLIVSPSEMRKLVVGTGWQIAKLVPATEAAYVAILEKVAA